MEIKATFPVNEGLAVNNASFSGGEWDRQRNFLT